MTFTNNLKSVSFFLIIILSFMGCDNNPPDPETGVGLIELNLVPRVGGQLYEKNTTFENIDGRRLQWESVKLYLSDFTLIKEDGTEEVLKTSDADSEVILFDFSEEVVKKTSHGDGIFQLFTVPAGDYKGVKISFGVPNRLNHGDASSFPIGHPLNDQEGMFTHASDGYVFFKLEGKIDSSASKNGQMIDQSLSYQLGTDQLFKTREYSGSEHEFTIIKNEELQFLLEIDLNRIFYTNSDTVNMVKENQVELGNQTTLGEKLMDNFIDNAIYKPPF